jgi:hypothetical protein
MSQPTSPSNPASTHTGTQDEGKQADIELVQVLPGISVSSFNGFTTLTKTKERNLMASKYIIIKF